MSESIRLVVVQPALPKYRVPVHRELAGRPGVDLRFWYGDEPGITNVEPEGFVGSEWPMRVWRVAGQEIRWHAAQIDAVTDPEVDAVVLSWGTRYLSLGPALRKARRRGVPVVLWGHGYSRSENPVRVWARNRIANLASTLLFYDQKTADAAVESGWAADRVFVAPNAIDQSPIAAARDACRADPAGLAEFREANGLAGRRVLLYVGRFTEKAKLPLLLDALDRLRREHPEVLVVLVGDGQLEGEVRRRVDELGLGEHVRLPGAIYNEQELASWGVSAEAFVYPSAIGLSLLHAFGYGLPVVTDDDWPNHNPEIVAYHNEDGSADANGLAYRAGDAGDLAAQLGRLLSEESLRERLARGARRTVEETYNVPQMVDGMVAAVRRAVAG